MKPCEQLTLFSIDEPKKSQKKSETRIQKEELKTQYLLLEKVAVELLKKRKELLNECRTELISLCLHITEKLLFDLLDTEELIFQIVSKLITYVIEELNQTAEVLYLSYKDYSHLQPAIEKGQISFPLKIKPKKELKEGSFTIAMEVGEIFYSLDREFEKLKSELLG